MFSVKHFVLRNSVQYILLVRLQLTRPSLGVSLRADTGRGCVRSGVSDRGGS